ncbi:E3 SUMO-protein ligase RanBP2-like [Artemia franciscana]|uniref:E3 SUMO-protein ligase RanBP2-like n=1 Tax=Artemia franciscana TaxID=6661 RepID=UPI0032DBB4E3
MVERPDIKAACSAEEKKKEETAKPNVFAGFTFGSPKLNELKPEDKTELKSDNGKKKSEEVTLTSILKGKDDTLKAGESTGMLFSSLTGSTEATCFKKTDDFKGFPGQGAPVFGKPKKEPTPLAAFPGSMERKAEAPEEEVSEEFVPTAEFKPVIPLPDLVEVKTGEDEETVLFSNRGILYRFDADTKEWKEKGRGDFKVLRHQKTGKVRFLMRREQVLKICCNHLITPELELMPMNNSDKAFVWYALDYSEGEMKEEKLALRFKLPDTAKELKQVVDKVKEELAKPSGEAEKPEAVEKDKSVEKLVQSLDKFKPAAGTWECSGCFCRNPGEVTQCPACLTMKPSAVAASKFRIGTAGTPTPGGFVFGVIPETAEQAAPTTAPFSVFDTPGKIGAGTAFSFTMKPTEGRKFIVFPFHFMLILT